MGARREEVAPRRLDGLDLSEIDWLIAGGESGRGHRPCRAEWLRDLRDACQTARVAFFFKQWGGARSKSGGRRLDGREHSEMPRVHAARNTTEDSPRI